MKFLPGNGQRCKLLLFPLRQFCLLVILVIISSCSTTRIVTVYDCDSVVNNPLNRKTTWSFAWGLVQPKDIHPPCDARFNHLNQVTVKTNAGFILISAVTLGIVIPQRVEWCCAPPEVRTDTLGINP